MVTETPFVYTPLTLIAPITVQLVGLSDNAQGIEMHVKMASAARMYKPIINFFSIFSIYSPLIHVLRFDVSMKDDALIKGAFHTKGR